MIRSCFTWFPIIGLGEPNLYQSVGCFTRMWDFTWWVVSLDWIIGEDFGKKFRRIIRKEDKLNYKI